MTGILLVTKQSYEVLVSLAYRAISIFEEFVPYGPGGSLLIISSCNRDFGRLTRCAG